MRHSLLFVLAFVFVHVAQQAQPLSQPFVFSMPEGVELDTTLLAVPLEPAGSRGRVRLDADGHFVFADGGRLRMVGTGLQWSGCFPDSVVAERTARRLRALGVNTVKFNAFDYPYFRGVSILADGNSTERLDDEQMRKLDYLVYQLKRNGIYSVFTFHSVWMPRPGDGVRQPDSVGWGTRMGLVFDPVVQTIHRRILRLFLEHVNEFTNVAYKDEAAIPFIIAAEDASVMAYWMYTQNVIRPNGGDASVGMQHLRLIDSLFLASLRSKGLTTDAALDRAWSSTVADTSNVLRNAGFNDPFNAAWILGVNTNAGAQAIVQYSDADRKEGESSLRVRIASLDANKQSYGIQLAQILQKMKRLHRYRVAFWAKTTPQRGSRAIAVSVQNSTYPYDTYGLAEVVNLTDQWQRFDYTFTCSASDSTSGAVSFLLGSDSGDVYIDDAVLREIPFGGLFPGESIVNGTVARTSVFDETISPARARDNAEFYIGTLKSLFDGVRRLVRDTLRSDVLLCPSARFTTFPELHAAKDYDVFSSTDWRSNATSMLSEYYGGSVYVPAQNAVKGKAMVITHSGIQYPRPYHAQVATIFPAYAGLHDWDGVFFSVFASRPAAGSERVDSNAAWEIMDKPDVLVMLPSTAAMMRRGDVRPSPKVVEITVPDEAFTYPRLHAQMPYSLGIYSDGRMPLFRRIRMNAEPAEIGSFLPHREISALASNDVDLRMLNAENDQIFWDASAGILRVQTDRYIGLSGKLRGELFTLPGAGLLVEQLDTVENVTMSIVGEGAEPIREGRTALLTIATRVLNEGATFSADNLSLVTWGTGRPMMEGTAFRITITRPDVDSVFAQPLGPDGRPAGGRFAATRSPSGRFTLTVSTAQWKTPWFRLQFGTTATSVGEDLPEGDIVISPNPAGETMRIDVRSDAAVDMVDALGRIVWSGVQAGGTGTTVDVHAFPAGTYAVRARTGSAVRTIPVVVAR
ncbi:MAG: carbohydrate binding domain-containing protein ['Candidatus Kapabacteria' thiocyanatum]|uniref:CBM-cenC domain-containing protein n=1 Tax=Candidatus Kapaibacterium thiocyanatum TaxID=1895771 RepID=A0A1M3KW69_9BACT|nr:carbohydrate binding domain-containing protein ['Candidatus Kapabacteria' thiocyanatum]OJX56658.1 MAG: hypothetical protein BGO89_08915 ['Candidatus Kapabacteria' thiocyanatum]